MFCKRPDGLLDYAKYQLSSLEVPVPGRMSVRGPGTGQGRGGDNSPGLGEVRSQLLVGAHVPI